MKFHFLEEIGVPYARLHDVGLLFGNCQYVDIPNIFKNFDADVNDHASYGLTDTMGSMHGDSQFAGSSSVPAHTLR